jgi:nucleoside-diphosphate-sugar epimerase
MTKRILVTGGAGFLGSHCKNELLKRGYQVVSVDLEKDDTVHPNLQRVQGDLRDTSLLRSLFQQAPFDAVFHFAAILAHAVKDKAFLWSSNVDATAMLADLVREFNVPRLIFTSSNCLWGHSLHRPVLESDPPAPVEIYGESKWEGEKILLNKIPERSTIIRCPTIIDSSRLGLLSILFEFIDEGRTVWTVGGGANRYQFIYAQDLIQASIQAAEHPTGAFGIFHIGSDNVKTFREVYAYVIEKAGSRSRIKALPRDLTIGAMRLAHFFGVSPLGPYHYKMIAEDFVFDTTKIKQTLGWKPTLTNEEMLLKAYQYFHQHASKIRTSTSGSAHRRAAKMGIIRLLKWVS